MEPLVPETCSLPLSNRKERIISEIKHATHYSGRFLKSSYVDGTRALIQGRYSRRQAALIAVSTLPAILGLLFLTVPGILFPTPSHNEFFHFAANIGGNPASMLPMILGAASATLGLRIPLS